MDYGRRGGWLVRRRGLKRDGVRKQGCVSRLYKLFVFFRRFASMTVLFPLNTRNTRFQRFRRSRRFRGQRRNGRSRSPAAFSARWIARAPANNARRSIACFDSTAFSFPARFYAGLFHGRVFIRHVNDSRGFGKGNARRW